jgi:hypothetical protein
MQYELYLKYDETMPIGVKGHWGNLCPHTFADIMYWSGNNDDDDINDEEDEGTRIGKMTWVTYNQSLAMVHGVNMTNVPPMYMQRNKEALFDLDYTHMSKETIDEIGAASNPNIVVLIHFGISADWRNKGLGEEILKGFIEQMKGKCGYVVIVHNVPAQCDPNSLYPKQGVELDDLEKDPEKAQWKLNAFWQRCGFRQFKNYHNVFICNVDQAVTEHRKAGAPAI